MSILPSYPFISIVIPTYNRVVLLQKAITSVIAQTYSHWELIVVDDGSTDHTAESVCSLKDPRVSLLSVQHSGNIASLRNAGVNAGSGEWIAFLDSDDEWMPGKLEIQLGGLLQEKKQWSYGRYELMDEASRTITDKSGIFKPISGWIAAPLITTEAAVNIGSLMIDRKLFNEAGGFNIDPKLIYREDYELALRLALMAEVLAIRGLLVRVREHASRTTRAFNDGHERTAFVYEHFLSLRPGNKLELLARKRMAHHLSEIAVNCMRNEKYFSALLQFARAFKNGDNVRHILSAVRRGYRKL